MSYERLTKRDRNRYGEVEANCETIQDVIDEKLRIAERLYELENKIESRMLVELPCKVGDTVYFVEKDCNIDGLEEFTIFIGKIKYFNIDNKIWFLAKYVCGLSYWHTVEDIKDTVFFKKEEAEAKLKELNK